MAKQCEICGKATVTGRQGQSRPQRDGAHVRAEPALACKALIDGAVRTRARLRALPAQRQGPAPAGRAKRRARGARRRAR